MSDLFEEDADEIVEIDDDFGEVIEAEPEIVEVPNTNLDARRRLENLLEEKRLRDELDDFVDY